MKPNDQVNALIDELLRGPGLQLPDTEHGVRCAEFADAIFSSLSAMLQLEPRHRRLAVAAALYHDVGYLRSRRDHHRKSFDILRDTSLPGIDEQERMVVACAARYHGGSYPNIEHAGFGEMFAEDQRLVRRIAAVTRVAAALDASHMGIVDRIEVGSNADGAWLIAYARQDASVESDRIREAEGGFLTLTLIPLRTEVRVVNEPDEQ